MSDRESRAIRIVAFGERIKKLREERGMSQRELAAASGIDFTYLSKIENARIEPPSEKVVLRMAQALDTDPDELTLLAGKIPADLKEHLDIETIKMIRHRPKKKEKRQVVGHYRRKPIVIEAIQYTGENAEEVGHFSGLSATLVGREGRLEIKTPEGMATVNPGDYVIRHGAGEFYLVKEHLFLEIYEPVEEMNE